jgi:hypothetical protein
MPSTDHSTFSGREVVIAVKFSAVVLAVAAAGRWVSDLTAGANALPGLLITAS